MELVRRNLNIRITTIYWKNKRIQQLRLLRPLKLLRYELLQKQVRIDEANQLIDPVEEEIRFCCRGIYLRNG